MQCLASYYTSMISSREKQDCMQNLWIMKKHMKALWEVLTVCGVHKKTWTLLLAFIMEAVHV